MSMRVRINGRDLDMGAVSLQTSGITIHCGEVEESRSKWVGAITKACMLSMPLAIRIGSTVYAATSTAPGAEIRRGFMEIIDVFTALAEPILWFYALIGCIMMATGKNRQLGWTRIKNVAYSYIAIVMLPTFFSFLHWVAGIVSHSIQVH